MCPYLEKKVKGITEMKDFIQRAEGSYRYVAAPGPTLILKPQPQPQAQPQSPTPTLTK